MTVVAVPRRARRVVTTEQMQELMRRGATIRLPQVQPPAQEVLTRYPKADTTRLDLRAEDNPIVSVEYVRDEPVQCISVDHPRHLYITDNFIPTHNTSNIVYLKSTDDSMIETLSKMSGTRHVTYRDSKSVTKDTERLIKGLNVEGKVTYTMNTKEEAVISYNDMAFISEKNSIVFRAGDAPVWNRNETILPMSFRLFNDTIVHPGHDYTLQTIPTLSSALDFDVRMNQPDFEEMLKKRMREAEATVHARALYQQVFEYSDVDIARLDPDVYADEVMELVDQATREMIAQEEGIDPDDADASLDGAPDGFYDDGSRFEEDMEMQREAAQRAARQAELDRKIYAGGTISRSNLVRNDGSALQGPLDREIVQAYLGARVAMERDTAHFTAVSGGTLRSVDGTKVYIEPVDESESVAALRSGSTSDTDGVYADDPDSIETLAALTGYRVDGSFYEFLASMDSWRPIAGGEFESIMAKLMSDDMV